MFVQGSIGRVVVVKQKHVDEVDEDAGGALGRADVKAAPLENDHENQVSEQTQDKNHLRNELQNDVESSSEVSTGGETHRRDGTMSEHQERINCPKARNVHFHTPH